MNDQQKLDSGAGGRVKPDTRLNPVFLILGFAGFLFVFISTMRYGPGLPPDSASYISSARNLLLGKGYFIFNGQPMTVAPPLFSTILAIIGLAGVDPLIGARFLNALAFGLIIFVSGKLFNICVRSRKLVVLGTVSVLFSLPLLSVSVMAWTEPLFILLSILAILCLFRFLDKKRRLDLFLLSLVTALCCIQRYVGVCYLFAGFAMIFFISAESFKQRLKYAAVFCFISFLPLLVWVARDYALTHTLFGARYFLPYSLEYNARLALNAFAVWFVPSGAFPLIKGAVVFLILLLAMIGFFAGFKRAKDAGKAPQPAILAGVYLLFYVLFLLIMAPRFAFGKEERSLSPIFVPLVFLFLVGLEEFFDKPAGFKISKKTVNRIAACLLVFAVIISFARCVKLSFNMIRDGAGGYNTQVWRESKLMAWIKTNSLNGFIFSNVPDGVYLLAGKTSDLSPKKYTYDAPNCQCDNLAEFTQALKKKPLAYLVWFKNGSRPYLYNIKELQSAFKLKEIVDFSDGTVYSLSS